METLVIKLGGSAGIDVAGFLGSLARVEGPYLLVHGGNVELDSLTRRLGAEPRLVTSSTGQVSRYTDGGTMDLFLMTYCGKINQRIVETLQRLGVNAVGLSAMDGGIAVGRRKARIRILDAGKAKMLEGDYAGTIERIDTRLLELLLSEGYIPVLTPPALSHDGEAINVDGDKLAVELAVALGAARLLIFSNTAGLLADLHDPQSTVSTVHIDDLNPFLALAQGRMKKKLLAAADAARRGVGEVILADANRANPIQEALAGAGTHMEGLADAIDSN